MKRRDLLALALTAAMPAQTAAKDKPKPVEEERLTPETLNWFDFSAVIPGNARDDSDWSEILVRFGQVLMGRVLSDDARKRTNARANSMRTDSNLFGLGETSRFKRVLCVIVSQLNDRNVKSRDA